MCFCRKGFSAVGSARWAVCGVMAERAQELAGRAAQRKTAWCP